jgi:hypothetical protein
MSHARLSVSIIIPTYNRAELVQEAVGSVLDQSRVPATSSGSLPSRIVTCGGHRGSKV